MNAATCLPEQRVESPACFHCGLPLPATLDLRVSIDGNSEAMCCYGCQAVAQAIVDSGQAHFYRVRSEFADTASELVPEFLEQIQIYDEPALQQRLVQQSGDDASEISLMLDGINCAACIWLIEQRLSSLSGVDSVSVNYATQRARLRWHPAQIQLSDIIRSIYQIGYKATPYDATRQQERLRQENRTQIRRLAIAAVFGMQVMMISISLYSGAWSGIEEKYATLFRWLAMILTIPVMMFSSVVFFRAALRDLANLRLGMDVPVALGIAAAFSASAYATWQGQGEIYFDSVVMFTFLLLSSRYFEWQARRRGLLSLERLAHALPATANRIDAESGKLSVVAVSMLKVDDLVLIKTGDAVPADGAVTSGFSSFDESLLNGESIPVARKIGDELLAGSINIENPLQMRVQSVANDTVLSAIERLVDRARSEKSVLTRLADRVAARFVVTVLLVVSGIALYWWLKAPHLWFEITLASLIVTCPCALSLATPAAFSTALNRLQSQGFLLSNGAALEQLNRVSHVVMDKTGTLTRGEPELTEVFCTDGEDRDCCLQIAAALESHSEHPLARALVNAASPSNRLVSTELLNHPGGGLSGAINGQPYQLGSIDFIEQELGLKIPQHWSVAIEGLAGSAVVLALPTKILCLFMLHDTLRSDTCDAIQQLQRSGKKVLLLSGDRASEVKRVAAQVGIDDWLGECSPVDKMERVQALQREAGIVLMVGDGINDAPVLAVADVSIAMAAASTLSKTSADAILINNQLVGIPQALEMASRCQRNIQQNFVWAIGYNACALPAAAVGLVSPWMAALGMSISSLLVVVNALRLSR